MELKLIRETFADGYTEGRLLADGKALCDTLEPTRRPLRTADDKVPGRTAVPAGRYQVRVTYSQRFKRDLPLLLRVPYFEGVRIHAGNSADDSAGCILVGKRDRAAGRLAVGSRAVEAALTDAIRCEPGRTYIEIVEKTQTPDGTGTASGDKKGAKTKTIENHKIKGYVTNVTPNSLNGRMKDVIPRVSGLLSFFGNVTRNSVNGTRLLRKGYKVTFSIYDFYREKIYKRENRTREKKRTIRLYGNCVTFVTLPRKNGVTCCTCRKIAGLRQGYNRGCGVTKVFSR